METQNLEQATFGGGCFWGVEYSFSEVEGVKDVEVGYMGGSMENPTYEDVSTGKTGYVEVVSFKFDPSIVSYDKLLEKFFALHNPTELDRQGPDVGSQYKSIIFYYNNAQRDSAEKMIEKLEKSGKYSPARIVTLVRPAMKFYRAEEYHQQYLKKRGLNTC